MGGFGERLGVFFNNRWLVFVAAMWIQSCAGIGYLFGSISPVIKSSLNYNQRQIARLGVAKDLGDCVGFLAGSLCEVLPLWGALLVGALQNLVGYGWVWLIVTGQAPALPLWAMCILIFMGTNGETYFNTAALVSCVQNFPKSRGPVVGILKGFAGLSGAILSQIYVMIHSPDHAALIFMIAVGPAMVIIALMFIVRPVGGHKQIRSSDGMSFSFIYSVCLMLAAYLMAVMLLEDLVDMSHTVMIIFTLFLFILLLIPIVIPVSLSLCSEPRDPAEAALLTEPQKQEPSKSEHHDINEVIFSEVEDEKPKGVDLLPASERQKRIAQLQAKIAQAAAVGAVRVKRRRGPHRGEDFTLMQALIKADFWLIFVSLLLGAGSGLTVIDNLGQMSQSLGFDDTHIFVSLISIWNFLGRVGGGYFSEIIVRIGTMPILGQWPWLLPKPQWHLGISSFDFICFLGFCLSSFNLVIFLNRDYAYPRPVAMAVAQVIMAFGHFILAMAWPGAMYISTLLIGLGYGAHWAIVPAAASELFGLKKFGALYNFLTLANPAGSLVFSGLIASSIYDSEAEKQAHQHHHPHPQRALGSILLGGLGVDEQPKCEGAICFFLTSLIMSGLCIIAFVLSMILVNRTKIVYAHLYGKTRT